MAQALLEQEVTSHGQQAQQDVEEVGGEDDHRLYRHSLSPGAESNHDSCYDSDSSAPGSRRNSSQRLDVNAHEDVSRQSSDTLAAEHSETEDKVPPPMSAVVASSTNRKGDNNSHLGGTNTSSDSESSEGMSSSDGYAEKVEFAVKLGYSEEQLRFALKKLGMDVKNNALLNELISLSSMGGGQQQDSDEEDPLDDLPLDVEVTPKDPGSKVESSQVVLDDRSNLKPIVIDGSNVAMSHGNKEVFSCQGIKLAVDWFRNRGHQEITVFVPQWRKETPRPDTLIKDQDILRELEKEKVLVFTPARRVGGKRVVCYDDRYIIKLAADIGGIVVSNDNYRDLINESQTFKEVIEERLLMYSFVNDRFMPPDDPLGRHGPSLDNYLCKEPVLPEPLPPVCPYNKKCTYGNKCKYYHPERGLQPHKSVTEKLAEQHKVKMQEMKERGRSRETSPGNLVKKKLSQTMSDTSGGAVSKKTPLGKTRSLVSGPKMPLSRTRSLIPPNMMADRSSSQQDSPGHGIQEMASGFKVTITNTEGMRQGGEEATVKHSGYRNHSPLGGGHHKTKRSPADKGHKPLRTPQHLVVSHDPLRLTHSDPHCYMGAEGGTTGLLTGHLALAKKLSDEGQSAEEPRLRSRGIGNAPPPPSHPPMICGPNHAEDESQNMHPKLARQLSLQGAEDPRWQQHLANVSDVPGRPNLQAATRTTSLPPSRIGHQPVIKSPSMGWDRSGPVEQDCQFISNPPSRTQSEYWFTSPYHQTIHEDHDSVGPPDRAPTYQRQQVHPAVTRIASAPVYNTAPAKQQSAMPFKGIHRQNSSSDPQLNVQREDVYSPIPNRIVYTESAPQSPRSPWAYDKGPITPPAYSVQLPDSPHRVTFGGTSNTCNRGAPQHVPVAMRAMDQAWNKPPPQLDHEAMPFDKAPGAALYPQQTTASKAQTTPVTRFAFGPRDHTYPASSNGSMRYAPPHPEHPLGLAHPLTTAPDRPISPHDPRYPQYYHLCALFPEAKVRTVMNMYPEETDSQKLCVYIIGMNG